MPSLELRTTQQTSTKVSDECVLLIAAEVHEAAILVDQLASLTGERFRVEWVPIGKREGYVKRQFFSAML